MSDFTGGRSRPSQTMSDFWPDFFLEAILKKCLNVRQKLGTWKFFNVFLRFPMFSNVFQCYLLSFSLSLSLTISLFLTLTLIQSLIQSLLTCWTTFVFISMLKTHPHTFSLSLSLAISLSLSHSFNLSFNHSRHAEQVLFSSLCSKVAVYSRKLQWFFLTSSSSSPYPVSLEFIELVPS